MKVNISDMMDHVESIPLAIREKDIASAERIKEATMKKIHGSSTQTHGKRKISRIGIVAAVIAATLCVTAAGAAVMKWSGFAFTDGMSNAEKAALIKNATTIHSYVMEDADGYVHYVDESGEEVLVLSPEEAARHEREQGAARKQAVLESTTLVNLSGYKLIPTTVKELPVDEEGCFGEFAMSNGTMILLHPEGEDVYSLNAGDVATITLDANDKCILGFGLFRNGEFVDEETFSVQQHRYSWSIEEDGVYCFSVMYWSTDTSTFTNCVLTVE